MASENQFQKSLKDRLRKTYPDCIILKNDPNQIQGFPDLLILVGKLWAALEVKKSKTAAKRPNQDYYVNWIRERGLFASFIYPENEEEVFSELDEYFRGKS